MQANIDDAPTDMADENRSGSEAEAPGTARAATVSGAIAELDERIAELVADLARARDGRLGNTTTGRARWGRARSLGGSVETAFDEFDSDGFDSDGFDSDGLDSDDAWLDTQLARLRDADTDGMREDDVIDLDSTERAIARAVMHPPPGYRRDRVGRWRYQWSGDYVPGARDVTVGHLHTPVMRDGCALIPRRIVMTENAFRWAETWPLGTHGSQTVHRVPHEVWVRAALCVVTLAAGELEGGRLLDPGKLAGLLGVQRTTIHAYRSRRLLPEATFTIGNTPVWALPVILDWYTKGRPKQRGRP